MASDSSTLKAFAIADLLAFDPSSDASNLLGDRWAWGSILWAGGSGYGKSTLAMQAGIYWAAGQAFFGIKPVRPLKVLIFQAENDRGDMGRAI